MSSFPLGAACTVLFSLFLALPAAANQQDPFWVVSHSGLLSTRLDPVVSPGGVSSHVHQIIGTSSFLPTYTYENNQLGKCTTANVGADKSSYWAPQMYYKWDNGTYSVMPLGYANTYYQVRRMNNEPMHAFPKGFRMLAGNANRNTYNQSDPTNAAVSYVCLGGTQPQQEKFPTEQCKDGLRAQVYFPHCWDGVNNWLPGSAHVSYGQTGAYDQGGQCPPTHPKRIMGLFYEFIYQDNAPYRPNGRVLANGDTVGYSFHGDFVNGWPVGLFEEIWGYGTQCDVGFSIEKCPPLARTKHTTGDGNGGDCKPEGLMVDEPIGFDALIASLPGSNPLWGGPSSPRPSSSSSSSSGSDAALAFISAVGKWKSGRLVGPDNVQLNASGLAQPTPGSTAGLAVGSGDGADPNDGVKVGGDGTWTDVYAGVQTPTGGVQSSQTTSASRGGGQEGSTGSLSGTGKTGATTTSSRNTGTMAPGTTTTRATTPASASSTASVRTSASTSAKAGASGSGSSVPSGGNLLASPTTSSASPAPTHSESSSSSSMTSSSSHLDSDPSTTPSQSGSVTAPASMASATSHTKHKHQHHTHTAQQKVTSTADAQTVVPTTTGSGTATAGSKTCVSGSNEKRDGMKRRRAGKGRRRSRI